MINHPSPKVTVFGSINLDIFIDTPHFPAIGETLCVDHVQHLPGGKGANQAVAAARLGASVTFVSAIGEDETGQYLLQTLQKENINTQYIKTVPDQMTGTAYVVRTLSNNFILVNTGAYSTLTRNDIEPLKELIRDSDIILLQLEIPLPMVEAVCEYAYQCGIPVILNPAPVTALSDTLLQQISVLTPNEQEFQQLFASGAPALLTPVVQQIQDKLIITQGEKGVLYYDQGEVKVQPAFSIQAVDTTGAGDVFNGGLAAFWHLGKSKAIFLACTAATLSTKKIGTQSGTPTYDEVEFFLNQQQY